MNLVVEVGPARGCGRLVTRRVEIIDVQDPRGELQAFDTTTMRFNEGPGPSCGLDVRAGDRWW